MEMANMSTSVLPTPKGTGGFMNPEKIVTEFGIQDGMMIADFGSGAGYFTILLAQRVGKDGKVFALDIQESALDNVRVKAKAVGLENVETIRGNFEVPGSPGWAANTTDKVLVAN